MNGNGYIRQCEGGIMESWKYKIRCGEGIHVCTRQDDRKNQGIRPLRGEKASG